MEFEAQLQELWSTYQSGPAHIPLGWHVHFKGKQLVRADAPIDGGILSVVPRYEPSGDIRQLRSTRNPEKIQYNVDAHFNPRPKLEMGGFEEIGTAVNRSDYGTLTRDLRYRSGEYISHDREASLRDMSAMQRPDFSRIVGVLMGGSLIPHDNMSPAELSHRRVEALLPPKYVAQISFRMHDLGHGEIDSCIAHIVSQR